MMKNGGEVILSGRYSSWFKKGWRRALCFSAYYKFAAKMIGRGKRVLDIGCGEGVGTWILAKECGFAKGVDPDGEALAVAKKNWKSPYVDFEQEYAHGLKQREWDAIVCFGCAELFQAVPQRTFFGYVEKNLAYNGIAILGASGSGSRQRVAASSRMKPATVSSRELLLKNMRRYFRHVFVFTAKDEAITAGFVRDAEYMITVGCRKK
jgi:cyclopropane fatty-acyl-phospholipid synthase-like methyltransferase